MTKAQRTAEAAADEILDQLASLQALLDHANKAVLQALRPKLMAIDAVQMHGYDASEPKNIHRWWSINTVDLMGPIRVVYLNNVDLDWNDRDLQEMFG